MLKGLYRTKGLKFAPFVWTSISEYGSHPQIIKTSHKENLWSIKRSILSQKN